MAIRKKGRTWYVDIYDRGKRIVRAIGPNKKLAEQVERKWKLEIAEGKFSIEKLKPSPSFRKLAEVYINNYSKVNKKSWRRDVVSLKNLLPVFGNSRLNEITPLPIEEYKKERLMKVTPSTVNKELACMKHMYNMEIKWKLTKDNPMKQVKLFREKNQKLRFLSEDEIQRLVKSCCPTLKPVVIMALSTGMRRGEILGLKWQDIDFEHNLITLSDTKSGYARQVKIDDELKRYLLTMKGKSRHKNVFTNSKGKAYRDTKTAFKTALDKAGIEGATFHTLRHTFAAHHAMRGTPIPTLMKFLGHRTIQMTMRYAHLSPDHLLQRANVYQRALKIIDSQNMVKMAPERKNQQH